MSTEEPTEAQQENLPPGPEPGTPEYSDPFAQEGHEELSERQVFVGDDDFYASFDQSIQSSSPAADVRRRPMPLSIAQKVLVTGIVLVGALLAYVLFLSPSEHSGRSSPTSA